MNLHRSQKLKKLLASKTFREPEEETIVLTGREITISQVPHIRADIKAAKTILDRLKHTECYTTQVIKVIES